MSDYLMSAYLSKYTYVSSQRVYVVPMKDRLNISFRGTTNNREVLSFFNVTPKPLYLKNSSTMLGHVHGGFLSSFNVVAPVVSKAIHDHKPRRITFSGHSKGGALAKIASVYYNKMLDMDVTCHTFGSPRVGDELFLEGYNTIYEQFNMAHFNDFVVTLPARYPTENVTYFSTRVANPHSINAYVRTLTKSINDFESQIGVQYTCHVKNDQGAHFYMPEEDDDECDSRIV